MGIKKKSAKIDKASIIEEARNYIEQINTLPEESRMVHMLNLYINAFKKGVLEDYFNHGWENIQEYYLPIKGTVKISETDIVKMYKQELKFLKGMSTRSSVPYYLSRLLIKNYLNNLTGTSIRGIRALEDFGKSEQSLSAKLKKEAQQLYLSIPTSSQSIKTDKKISVEIINHIMMNPFYDQDLKYLILRSEDSAGTKGMKGAILKSHLEFPYELSRRETASFILERYLVYANKFRINENIELLDKKMPIKDGRIYDLILEENPSLKTTSKIHSVLRKIFALNYKPKE
jgi:hypothetical protein